MQQQQQEHHTFNLHLFVYIQKKAHLNSWYLKVYPSASRISKQID